MRPTLVLPLAGLLLLACIGVYAESGGSAPATAPATAGPLTQPVAGLSASRPAARPITLSQGQVGDLLRKWRAEGEAAGNEGDYYDNRDRGHSELGLDPYPQVQRILYSPEERDRGLDWALQARILPHVVFGNSSTSAAPTAGGSNPRRAYSSPLGLDMLYAQYRGNNLYVYPSHLDHNPGHNGAPGYGDLFPANTPYLIISQGSSGSDQAFLRAIPHVLAAFRPEVKRRLTETGLLMPTVQMILRETIKPVSHVQDYLTGAAHPTVFEGSWVEEARMVQVAHALALQGIPPMVQLRVTEEDRSVPGRDFFDLHTDQRLGDTPAAIARIFRTRHPTYRMVVSAEGSFDVNRRPLEFHWVVLRGDASRIHLKPLNEAGSVCEIVAGWPPRGPVARGSALESSRTDIGVFVDNGAHYSAPGFVTFFSLDDEARTYDSNDRLLELGYGLGAVRLSILDWGRLLDLYGESADSPGARLVKKGLAKEALASVQEAAEEYRAAQPALKDAQQSSRRADETLAKAREALKAAEEGGRPAASAPRASSRTSSAPSSADLQEARQRVRTAEADAQAAGKAVQNARKALDDILALRRQASRESVKERVERTLMDLAGSATLHADLMRDIAALAAGDPNQRSVLVAARQRLVDFGLLREAADGVWELTPLREGNLPAQDRLTLYEHGLLEQFNAVILSRVFYGGMIELSYTRNYVDPRLDLPKTWRDIYRYSPKGDCVGWTRYDATGKSEFNAWGLMVLEKDALGRCVKAQAVSYVGDSPVKGPMALWSAVLKQVPAPGIVEYEYAGDDDWIGKKRPPSTSQP